MKRDKEKDLMIERLSLQIKDILKGKEETDKKIEDLESKILELNPKSASSLATTSVVVNTDNAPSKVLWSTIVAPHSSETAGKTKKSEPEIAVLNSVFSEQLDRGNRKRNVIVFETLIREM